VKEPTLTLNGRLAGGWAFGDLKIFFGRHLICPIVSGRSVSGYRFSVETLCRLGPCPVLTSFQRISLGRHDALSGPCTGLSAPFLDSFITGNPATLDRVVRPLIPNPPTSSMPRTRSVTLFSSATCMLLTSTIPVPFSSSSQVTSRYQALHSFQPLSKSELRPFFRDTSLTGLIHSIA